MAAALTLESAVSRLKTILTQVRLEPSANPEIVGTTSALEGVLARYQPIFRADALPRLTEEEFRDFLQFRNNRHWLGLQRMGPSICSDMGRLRKALGILLDESRPIRERLNQLIPVKGPAFVPRLSRAVLTPILLIAHPEKYGVWNNISEGELKTLGLWPDFERRAPFGDRYEKLNDVLVRLASAVGTDLWTLDALWWRLAPPLEGGEPETTASQSITEPTASVVRDAPRFGLERHLHEFLRDNWNKTELGKAWKIYEEDGDPEAGYEYPCGVGRIDILAHHRSEPRWLVVELKKSQTSDDTVGQVLRYMGWVKLKLAEPGEKVEGIVVAPEADDRIRYALSAAPNVHLMLYEVEFRLARAQAVERG